MTKLKDVNWEETLRGVPAKIRIKDRWRDYYREIKILKDCGDRYIIHDPENKSVYGVKKNEVIIDGEE